MKNNFSRYSTYNVQHLFSGFTLLELLIVIAVIGGLAAISVNAFPAAGRSARDATRRSDIKQFQTALETYNNKTGSYYASMGTPAAAGVCSSSALNLPKCPTDPKATWNYTLNSTATQYVIYAQLEKPLDSTKPYFVVCSDGRAGECASPGAVTTCAVGAGSCP